MDTESLNLALSNLQSRQFNSVVALITISVGFQACDHIFGLMNSLRKHATGSLRWCSMRKASFNLYSGIVFLVKSWQELEEVG